MIKVMIVEDEPEIRRILEKMIEKQDGFPESCKSSANLVILSFYTLKSKK